MPRPTAKPSGLSKPTMDTPFLIDYDWWEQPGKDLRVDIQLMCSEIGETDVEEAAQDEVIDWIDPETAVVRRVDGLMYMFLSKCSRNPEFISERIPLTEAVFRVLLASGNRPMKPGELAERTGRSAEMILKTLSGRQVYKGIRPQFDDES